MYLRPTYSLFNEFKTFQVFSFKAKNKLNTQERTCFAAPTTDASNLLFYRSAITSYDH